MPAADIIAYAILLVGAVLSYRSKKLTLSGAITGALVGLLIYKGAGYTGIFILAVFFITGSAATGWQQNKKLELNATDENKGRRTTGQVLANGGTAAVLGALAWYLPAHIHILQVMIAGSLAAATADTLSSELGTVYGRRFYNVLTFKKDQCGLDGVISLEGTVIGVAGAALIAGIYAMGFGWSIILVWIIIAGIIGNLIDSVLGAALERKGLISNNLVNFLTTLTGALAALILVNLV